MNNNINVSLCLVESRGSWLIGRRAPGRDFAGCWEFPGGKALPGETPEAAAAREAFEELGVRVQPVRMLGSIETAHGPMLNLVLCRWIGGEPNLRDEAVDDFRWVPSEALDRLDMPPANREVLAILREQGLI